MVVIDHRLEAAVAAVLLGCNLRVESARSPYAVRVCLTSGSPQATQRIDPDRWDEHTTGDLAGVRSMLEQLWPDTRSVFEMAHDPLMGADELVAARRMLWARRINRLVVRPNGARLIVLQGAMTTLLKALW